jgi:hypothetical protein
MLSRQEEEAERIETMRNDASVREQQKQREAEHQRNEGTTFHQFAQSQAGELSGGRFAAIGTPNVTGTAPIPTYPAASPSWQIQLPDEPPLGVDNPAIESSAAFLPAEEGASAADEALASEGDRPSAGVQAQPPSSDAVETASAGAPPFF